MIVQRETRAPARVSRSAPTAGRSRNATGRHRSRRSRSGSPGWSRGARIVKSATRRCGRSPSWRRVGAGLVSARLFIGSVSPPGSPAMAACARAGLLSVHGHRAPESATKTRGRRGRGRFFGAEVGRGGRRVSRGSSGRVYGLPAAFAFPGFLLISLCGPWGSWLGLGSNMSVLQPYRHEAGRSK